MGIGVHQRLHGETDGRDQRWDHSTDNHGSRLGIRGKRTELSEWRVYGFVWQKGLGSMHNRIRVGDRMLVGEDRGRKRVFGSEVFL